MTIDIDKIKAKMARYQQEKDTRDGERGFCAVKLPELPESIASDVLARTVSECRPFLIKYAEILAETGEWVRLDDHVQTKLNEWITAFVLSGHCNNGVALRYNAALGRIIGDQTEDPLFWAEWIYMAVNTPAPCSTYDGSPEDYELEYAQYKEGLLTWRKANIN